MSWRTVIISSRCKLDLKMGYLVVRGEDVKRIYLDEIGLLLIENPAVALTGCLLSALTEKKIKVLFCDNRHMPQSELIPVQGSYDSARKIKAQIAWDETLKGVVWGEIIRQKIFHQALFLSQLGFDREEQMLKGYLSQLEFQDATNREGHAAKVYFNAVFGMEFTRSGDSAASSALDYGYTVLLSAFNREISACGYLTQLGLHHDNGMNPFNLSSDLMEPFRICVDRIVYREGFSEFDKDAKRKVLAVLNEKISIQDSRQTVLNAIGIYVRSVFEALNQADPTLIRFYTP